VRPPRRRDRTRGAGRHGVMGKPGGVAFVFYADVKWVSRAVVGTGGRRWDIYTPTSLVPVRARLVAPTGTNDIFGGRSVRAEAHPFSLGW
jgi:hypothetical protein